MAFFGFVEGDAIRHHTFVGTRTRELENIELKKGTGLGWLVLKERRPVVVEDFFHQPAPGKPALRCRQKGGADLPLGGALHVRERRASERAVRGEPQKKRFTEEHIRTLVLLATQASVAVEHAKLYEELKRAYRELQRAYGNSKPWMS